MAEANGASVAAGLVGGQLMAITGNVVVAERAARGIGQHGIEIVRQLIRRCSMCSNAKAALLRRGSCMKRTHPGC